MRDPFLLLGVLSLLLSSNDVVGECPPDNDGDAVYLPHELDCTLFYECRLGLLVQHGCPSGLHFNPILQACDWPALAGCDGPSTIPTPPPPPDSVDPPVTGQCPPDNDGDAVYLPHEFDCALFYRCELGLLVQHGCPSGLHFNPILQACDWPALAGCDGPSTIPTPPPPPDSVDPPVTGQCPPDNDGDAVYLPHEFDCTLFYECRLGLLVQHGCPSGLHFNPILQACDWPALAGCDGPSTIPTPPPPPDSVDPPVTGQCPPDNDGDAVYLPHEFDCTLFYECRLGLLVQHGCPSGLHFNPILQACDWPALAGCDGPSTVPTPPPPPDSVDPPVTGQCPPDNDGDAVYLPHEFDCTLFYECKLGLLVQHGCPSGLHFNPILQACDWPALAGCDGPSTIPTPPPPPDSVDPPVTGQCPPDNDGDAVYLPHEFDCALFYRCELGLLVQHGCPSGLHFNPILQACDWPALAGCDGPSTIPTPPPPPDSVDPPVTGQCPPDNDGDAVYLPHEFDCTLFYECRLGLLVQHGCPSGLHFNPILQACDWPALAGCDGPSTVPTPPPPPDSVDPPVTGQCPPDNDGDAVYLPHEFDCTPFYECKLGLLVQHGCPSGLHFNPILQACDWPALAGCDGPSTIPTPPPPPDSVDPPVTGQCPPDNDGDAVYLPHEFDCALFYRCELGLLVQHGCPSGLHFNPILQACDWPALAGCDGPSTIPTPPPPPDSVDPPVTGQCPPDNDGDAVYLPHEFDCTLFYECRLGLLVQHGCPSGLHFNPILQACDWPALAGCDGT